MNLLELREQFVRLSGRYDLASSDYATNTGADFYIQSGTRLLDRIGTVKQSRAGLFEEVASGLWYLAFQNCLAIESVWCNDDESQWQLTRYPYATLRKEYSGLVSESDGGAPRFYCPIWLRSTDDTVFQSLGTFFNYVDTDDDGTYNGILFTPKTDKTYNLEIVGRFASVELSNNADSNYWSTIAPEILLKAAIYQLEVFSFNRRKAAEWLGEVRAELQAMEFNMIEEESNEARIVE